jgi:proteic killer suppression protein
MIKSFKHKGLEKLFLKGDSSKILQDHVKRLRLILAIIHKAKSIEDVNFVGSSLHESKGDKKGIWSVTVRANWRITFKFEDGNAYILNYEDYH